MFFFFLAYLFQRNFSVFTVQLVTLQQTRQFLTKVSCCHQIRIGGGSVPLMGRKKEGKEALLVLASGMPTFSHGAAILCKKIFQTQVIELGSRKCPGLVPVWLSWKSCLICYRLKGLRQFRSQDSPSSRAVVLNLSNAVTL